MKAMILAAGYGTRLLPYTNILPKPLFPLAGRPLLDILIEQLAAAGCESVALNTHHLDRKIESFIRDRSYPIPVIRRFEPSILGTGGGIRNFSDFWDDRPFLVINGDIYTNIDFKTVYDFHCSHTHPATLVLVENSELNSVSVDGQGWVRGFGADVSVPDSAGNRLLTFTGIQVLNPEFLDYVSANDPQSSIDAFRRMLSEKRKIAAFIPGDVRWDDLGTVPRYRAAAVECSLARAWQECFPDEPLPDQPPQPLAGDGSERCWYRIRKGDTSLIMVDHGIRRTEGVSEIDSFIHIGEHLHAGGISVPKIYFSDPFAGLVFLEDLGDNHLQRAVRRTADVRAVARIYRRVIDQLVRLATRGRESFNESWCYQSPRYDKRLIIEKECRYFVEAFLNTHLRWQASFEEFEHEFNRLAEGATRNAWMGFMHRDCQSRNIMLHNQAPFFIDFQGGRIGPIQYDLASLLIDPYVELPRPLQRDLLDYGMQVLEQQAPLDRQRFERGYRYAALARNLQILGAFGHLSTVRGKPHFLPYIPAALRCLHAGFNAGLGEEFPGLAALAGRLVETVG
jgi:aminoglycoside/choline kinase family phosphotransferase/choline kinase